MESAPGTTGNILLIEEYDALAAALSAALNKFAPQHRTRVVDSLPAGESAAAEIHPQLIVVDFDPPHSNAIDFFYRLSKTQLEARVLVIASGVSSEFIAQRYGPNAIQFVDKPFELAEFGAAVQALLGPWAKCSSGDSRGTLRDLNLKDLVPLECMTGASITLQITASRGRVGEIHFCDGQICHANAGGLSGIDAFHEIMRWPNANATEAERPVDGPQTIHGPWQHVFLEALEATKPGIAELPVAAPSEAPLPEPKVPKTGKKIVVIDDTEMLLMFVEDVLSIADPALQITTASGGREGVRQAKAIVPDLVLLDYSLADLPGDQVCERLLQDDVTSGVPVIMMSGHVPEMMATANRCPNVVATIAKPFMSEALVQLVRETLVKGPRSSAPGGETTKVSCQTPPGRESQRPNKGAKKKPVEKEASGKSPAEKQLEKSVKPTATAIVPGNLPTTTPSVTPRVIRVPTQTATQGTMTAAQGLIMPESRPVESSLLHPPAFAPSQIAKPATPKSTVVLAFGVEVISVQFTSQFQVSRIRVKPISSRLSLSHLRTSSLTENRVAGFELERVQLDTNNQMKTIRVRPTHKPTDSIQVHNGFDINDVELLNEPACIQFTARSSAPMILQLDAIFRVIGVELSNQFEVAQLVLQPQGDSVQITFEPQSAGARGAAFKILGLHLDSRGRIAEFVLQSLGA